MDLKMCYPQDTHFRSKDSNRFENERMERYSMKMVTKRARIHNNSNTDTSTAEPKDV